MDKVITILFLAANPTDSSPLRLSEEVRTIDERLRMGRLAEKFELNQCWAVRETDLSEALLRYEPRIVHFSGHGNNSGEIVLESSSGKSHPVSAQALAKLFQIVGDNVQCVVLNACFSERQAEAIARYVDCVVGMSGPIDDSAAIAFAGGFYRAIGYGKSVQTAFDLGCNEIDLKKLEEKVTPKILARKGVNQAEFYLTGVKPIQGVVDAQSRSMELGIQQIVSGDGNVAINQGSGSTITIKSDARTRRRIERTIAQPNTLVYFPLLKDHLRERIDQLATYRLQDNLVGDRTKPRVYGKIFRDLKLHFGIPEFACLPVSRFDEALSWVEAKIRKTRYGRINQKRSRNQEAGE